MGRKTEKTGTRKVWGSYWDKKFKERKEYLNRQ